MLFRLKGDWPVAGGSVLVPAGTEIDGNDPQWRGIRLPLPMPLNAYAIDQAALNALAYWHGEEAYRWLHYAPGLRLPDPRNPPQPPTRKDTSQ
jgi:hypothetical protein